MLNERRRLPREALRLRVCNDHGDAAVTRDLNAQGLYLQLPAGQVLDDWVCIELAAPSRRLLLRAVGEVLRIERGADGVGVAVRLHGLEARPCEPEHGRTRERTS